MTKAKWFEEFNHDLLEFPPLVWVSLAHTQGTQITIQVHLWWPFMWQAIVHISILPIDICRAPAGALQISRHGDQQQGGGRT